MTRPISPRPALAGLLAGLALAAPLTLGGAATATADMDDAAASGRAQAADCLNGSSDDVNGDGFADLVAGDPSATVAGRAGAGSVVVRYGTAAGPGRGAQVVVTQQDADPPGSAPEVGDAFGGSVALGLVDGDLCADLVIGVPGEDVGTARDTGAVQVIFGSPTGPGQGRTGLTVSGSTSGFGTGLHTGDRFGTDVALTDLLDPTKPVFLAIGAPGRPDGSASSAGAVAIAQPMPDGQLAEPHLITQSSPGVGGISETGDRFGAAVDFGYAGNACAAGWCQELIVGTPGENAAAGALTVIDSSGTPGSYVSSVWSQDSPGAADVAESGDGFASSLDFHLDSNSGGRYLAVGVPNEDVGAVRHAGAVQLFRFGGAGMSTASDELVSEDTADVGGVAEAYDHFGSSVLATEAYTDADRDYVVVGTPWEDIGSLTDAGAITVFNVSGLPGDLDRTITQSSAGVPGTVHAGEHTGRSLATTGLFDDLAIGAPDDVESPRGAVLIVPWDTVLGFGPAVSGSLWTPPSGVRMGTALAGRTP